MPLLHRKPAPVPLAFSPLVETRSLARYQAGGGRKRVRRSAATELNRDA